MAATTLSVLAAAGSTGNNTHALAGVGAAADRIGVQFVVEAIGATPTVTWKVQGSLDGVNWYDVVYYTDALDTLAVAARTATTVSAQVEWLDLGGGSRFYDDIRVITSSNTNVTYRCELYVQTRQ